MRSGCSSAFYAADTGPPVPDAPHASGCSNGTAMQTAATPEGNGWPGSSGRACCTPFDVYGDEKVEDLSGSALSGALVPLEVECEFG